MSSSRRTPSGDEGAPTEVNAEWRLVDLLASIGREADQVLERLQASVTARGTGLAVQNLGLDLAVTARVDQDGQLLYRTVAPGEPSETVLKLELGPMFRSQLAELTTAANGSKACGLPIAALPGVTPDEVTALAESGIRTLADLEPLGDQPELLARLTLQTEVAEWKLRDWLGLPYLRAVESEARRLVALGGNFGPPDPEGVLMFWDRPSPIEDWSDERLAARIPEAVRNGPVYAVLHGQCTNALPWRPERPRPRPDPTPRPDPRP